MKATLPFFLFLVLAAQSQTQINTLNGTANINEMQNDGQNYRIYSMFAPETVFDQSSAGFDQNWDVSAFVVIADLSKLYQNTIPTADELFQFPGAMIKTTGRTITDEESEISSVEYVSSNGLMSYVDQDFILNYAADNADYGSFPQMYGDLHYDTTAGAYTYGDYSGTFVGTLITEVDAYGTIATDEGTFDVTRLKTIQTLQLNYPGFGNVGTFTQTIYRYYRPGDLWPLVKSTNTVLTVALLGIDSNTTQIEKAPAMFLLSTQNPAVGNAVTVVPNPVLGKAEIITPGNNVLSATIIDNSGKEVFTQKGNATLDLSALQAGIYFARIVTPEGSTVKKIIRK